MKALTLCNLTVSISVSLLLGGCGEQSSPEKVQATSPAPLVAAPAWKLDFRSNPPSDELVDVSGLSFPENWGRWSDANLAASIKLKFKSPLPEHMVVVVTGRAFGPNVGAPINIKAGDVTKEIFLTAGDTTTEVAFSLASPVDTLEIIPPSPESPKELQLSDDGRRLGVGLVAIRIDAR